MSDFGLVTTSDFSPPIQGQSLLGQIPGAAALGIGTTGDTPIMSRAKATSVEQLATKYRELGPTLQQLPPHIAQALIDFDAKRVARGAMPLNDTETVGVLRTAISGKPATPAPERSLLNVPGNFLRDLGDIVRSVPRLPGALVNEARELPHIGERIAEAQAAGANPITALAQAPGVRLIPGAYVVGNLAAGGSGLRELATHPLMTTLDLLPAASEAAKATAVGRRAGELAEAAGTTSRPLKDFLTRRLDDTGELAPRRGVEMLTDVRDNTQVGQRLDRMFGGRARQVMRWRDELQQHVQGVAEGVVEPTTLDEANLAGVRSLAERHPDVTPTPDLYRKARLGETADMTGPELAYVNDWRELQDRIRSSKEQQGIVGRITVDGTTEVYNAPQFERYQALATLPDTIRRKAFMREQVLVPTLDVDQYVDAIAKAADAPLFGSDAQQWTTAQRTSARATGLRSRAEAVQEARAAQYALGRLGLDTTELRKAISAFSRGDASKLVEAAEDFRQRRPIIADRKKLAFAEREADRFADRLSKFTEQRAVRAEARADSYLTNTPPARFKPLLEEQVDELARAALEGSGLDVLPDAERAAIQREVVASWRQLKARGIDPVFVHNVPVNRLGQALRPQVSEVPNSVSSGKFRSDVESPPIQDLQVSLTHEAMELVTRPASEELVARIARQYGVRQDELLSRTSAAAQRIYERSGGLVNEAGARQQALLRGWTKLDTVKGYNWGAPTLQSFAADQVWVPNSVAETIRAMHQVESPFAVMDPVTRAFRMSVIGLSPRTHINNIVGGAIMTTAEGGPLMWRHAREAWALAKDPSLATDPALAAQLGAAKRLFADLDAKPFESRAVGLGEYLKGRSLGRLWDQAQAGKVGDGVRKVGDLAQRSMDLNGTVDNFYRAMSYLDGKDKALTKGMTTEAAQRAGLEMARKTMMDWAGMTPFERSIMKSIIPFYGFTAHILRYVSRYPVDHPVRTSIIAKLGEAEAADAADDLGTRWLGSIFLSQPDAMGRVNTLNVDAMNPFRDTAHMLTLQGFLGSTNPIIATMLEQVGVTMGEAELYPTLRYDPETGRLATSHSNPLLAFVENTIPQTQILTGLAGMNAELRERMRYDPASALRSMAGSAGIPMVWRNINLPQEQFKAELAREDAAAVALRNAMRSGNWTTANRWPTVAAAHEQLRQVPAEQLAAFAPPDLEELLAAARQSAGVANAPGLSAQGL